MDAWMTMCLNTRAATATTRVWPARRIVECAIPTDTAGGSTTGKKAVTMTSEKAEFATSYAHQLNLDLMPCIGWLNPEPPDASIDVERGEGSPPASYLG